MSTEQTISADQRNMLWVFHRETQMHGAPPIKPRMPSIRLRTTASKNGYRTRAGESAQAAMEAAAVAARLQRRKEAREERTKVRRAAVERNRQQGAERMAEMKAAVMEQFAEVSG